MQAVRSLTKQHLQAAVEDVTEAIGDISSAALSTIGKVASAGVSAVGDTASALLVQPLKAIGKMAKSATTPVSSTFVTSSFRSVSAIQVFPTEGTPGVSARLSSRLSFNLNTIPAVHQIGKHQIPLEFFPLGINHLIPESRGRVVILHHILLSHPLLL